MNLTDIVIIYNTNNYILIKDSFYRDLTDKEKLLAEKGLFNFDHPDAFDIDLMEKCLSVSRGGSVRRGGGGAPLTCLSSERCVAHPLV